MALKETIITVCDWCGRDTNGTDCFSLSVKITGRRRETSLDLCDTCLLGVEPLTKLLSREDTIRISGEGVKKTKARRSTR